MGRFKKPPSSSSMGLRKLLRFKNPSTEVKFSRIADTVSNVLEDSVDVARAVNEMGSKPKLRNYAALGVVALSKLTGATGFNPIQDPRFICVPSCWDLSANVKEVFSRIPGTTITKSGEESYQTTEIEGGLVLFSSSDGSPRDGSQIWMVPNNPDASEQEMSAMIGREIWKSIGTRLEVVTSDSYREDSTRGGFRVANMDDAIPSEQGDEVHSDIQKFLTRGYRRSIVLYGEPGTGKSCMVKYILSKMSATTLFMEQTQVSSLGYHNLAMIMDMLDPEVLVIDDFDRIPFLSSFLGSIDKIRQRTKLLIVTMNHMDQLDPAVIRAGRFSELIEVHKVLSVEDLLPELDKELHDELREWPVSFLDELRDRIDVLGKEEALSSNRMDRLRRRVKANSEVRYQKEGPVMQTPETFDRRKLR